MSSGDLARGPATERPLPTDMCPGGGGKCPTSETML